MSYFGYGTLKQEVLDIVQIYQEENQIKSKEIIVALAEIIQFYAENDEEA